MASPILNLTIFRKSTPHAFRAYTLAIFPLAFLYLLIHGIASGMAFPALGIIPLFMSAAYSALLLSNEKKCGCQANGLTGTPIHLFCDLIIGVLSVVCLVCSWITLCNHWDRAAVMFGTYGTNFLVVDFWIHVYFVGKQLLESLGPGPSYPASCPHCQNATFTVGSFQIGRKLRDGYAPLLDGNVPRVSVDEPREDTGESAV